METLEVLNRETLIRRNRKPPVVRVSYGRVIFSVEAVRELGLKEGDKISFVTNPKDMDIIYFKKDERGVPLAVDFNGLTGTRLRICCRPLAEKILSFFSFKSSKTFSVTNNLADMYGEKMWFLLRLGVHKPIKWRK